jgi:hypothetical protein
MAPTWFFKGRSGLIPETLCLYCRTSAHLMESSGLSSDSPSSNIESHTLGTLNDGHMGLVGVDSIMMAHRWDGSPNAHRLGRVPQSLLLTKIKDVATADSQRHGRDEMQLPRALTQHLDLGN